MFDWDEGNLAHIARHGVSREEAEQAIVIAPADVLRQYYGTEERLLQLGATKKGRVLAVVSTWRGDLIRIITAWDATAADREFYWLERSRIYGN